MGKDKSLVALKHLIDLGVEVVAVVAPSCNERGFIDSKFRNTAEFFQLPICSDIDIYAHLAKTKTMNLDLDF